MHPVTGTRALRKGRASLAGQAYLITTVVHARRRLFTDFEVACAASRVLGTADSWGTALCLAWVLMPDHAHFLIELGEGPISSVMQRVKGLASHAVGPSVHGGQLWQRGYYEHALRTEESVIDAAGYLVANPLRAGLVERIGDYSFWDAVWLDATLLERK
jgi:REP element-mobilizing transposase RayT